jgi:hypothetical protein
MLESHRGADEIDPHYAKLRLAFFAGMLGCGHLDERTRMLNVVCNVDTNAGGD